MAIKFGEAGFKFFDKDALANSISASPLKDILAQDSESGWPFVEGYLTTHLSRQLEHRTNHPDDEIYDPLYTANFYERYSKWIGGLERYATTDQFQLTKRIINHPRYLQTVMSTNSIQLTFIGCGSGRYNADANIIDHALSYSPKIFNWELFKTTKLVAIEPYPPAIGKNPALKPFYEQGLNIVAQNPREFEATDGAFLLGSPRMDILDFFNRLQTLAALNSIIKPGGFVAIDEACPAYSMPDQSAQNAYQSHESLNNASHSWMAEGFFKRTWQDREGEFGKYFYAEPFEIYYTLMRQAGFKLSIGSYGEIMQLFHDPRLQKKSSEWERVKSRTFKPKDTFEQIFYQTSDEQRVYNRYLLFWEKEGSPRPEFLDFISSFESYEKLLNKRLKQVSIN